MTEFIFPYM